MNKPKKLSDIMTPDECDALRKLWNETEPAPDDEEYPDEQSPRLPRGGYF